MKKIIWWIVGLVVIVIVIVAIAGVKSSPSGSAIKLGFIGPLTGDAAVYGTSERNVTNMVVEEVNKAGGINGRKIEVIYEDGHCNGKDASSAAQKLINVDGVRLILGGICSVETLAAAPVAEKSKVILFAAFSSAPAVSAAGDYIFRNSPSDNDSGKIDAELLAKRYKKVAIISEQTDYSAGLRQVLLERLPKSGITIVDDEQYKGDTKDFRTILLKVKASNPEAIYFNPGTSPQAAGFLVKQARELGITVPAYFNFFMGNVETIKIASSSADGVIFSDASGLRADKKALLEQYKARFGTDPGSEYELGAAYDRIQIVVNALKAVGDDPDKVKSWLYSMPEYDGTIGRYRFDQNGDVVGVGFAHYIIKGGKKTLYSE